MRRRGAKGIMATKERQDRVRATSKEVLRATASEGHCLSVHDIRHAATTLNGWNAIPDCKIDRLASLSSLQKFGYRRF